MKKRVLQFGKYLSVISSLILMAWAQVLAADVLPENLISSFIVENPADLENTEFFSQDGNFHIKNADSYYGIYQGVTVSNEDQNEFVFTFEARTLDLEEFADSEGYALFSWLDLLGDRRSTKLSFSSGLLTWEIGWGTEDRVFDIDEGVFSSITIYKLAGDDTINLVLKNTIVSAADASLFSPIYHPQQAGFGSAELSWTEWRYMGIHLGDGALDVVRAIPEVNQIGVAWMLVIWVGFSRTRTIRNKRANKAMDLT